ncbi:MAG: dihydrodipicolinate synthase family protein [Chthonomonadetes bacterium]|nr:dihydrodipicolinate synthase family protein [Chthonomonadetes bacterium]
MAGSLPQGVYTALVTPITRTGEVDYGAFRTLIDWQRQHGVQGVVVCGTTGEGTSLSVEERERAIATVREYAADLRVIAGTGCANLPETVHLSRFAQQQGCDAILALPPFYYKHVPEEGLVAYFMRLLDSVDMPTLLYNYPDLAGVHITPTVVESLLEYPHLLGVKDSSGNWETLLSFLLRLPRMQIFVGAENLLADALSSGAAGCISGLANAFPDLIVQIDLAVRRGEDATLLNERLAGVLEAMDSVAFIPAIKQVCEWRGLPKMWVRPPLCDLSATQSDTLRHLLVSLEVL